MGGASRLRGLKALLDEFRAEMERQVPGTEQATYRLVKRGFDVDETETARPLLVFEDTRSGERLELTTRSRPFEYDQLWDMVTEVSAYTGLPEDEVQRRMKDAGLLE